MLLNKTVKNIVTISGLVLAMCVLGHANIHADNISVNQSGTTTSVQQTNDNSNKQQPAQVSEHTISPAQNRVQNHRQRQFKKIYKVAHSKLGDSYAWGATGPNRFDCSGFTQYVYKHGIHKHIPRTAEAQRRICKRVSYKRARPGDLAFFGYGTASHVGLYIGKDKMIDAQNRGVIIEHVHAPWWHILSFGRILK